MSKTAPSPDDWRGVAAEDVDEVTSSLSGFLRSRSRALLGTLMRPHRPRLYRALGAILVFNMCAMAGPYLVKLAIDTGIPPMQRGEGSRTLLIIIGHLLRGVDRPGSGRQRLRAPQRPHRPGRPARPARPPVRPLPTTLARLPRALHVGPRHLPAHLRRRPHSKSW